MESFFWEFVFLTGLSVTFLALMAAFSWVFCYAADFLANKWSSTVMVALYWIHRKEFHRWCRENRDKLSERQQSAFDEFGDDAAAGGRE